MGAMGGDQVDTGETMIRRRFLVFDGDGELVATFPEWGSAHAWAHLRAMEPRTPQPVQVEDRCDRRTWTIEAGRCRMTVWRCDVEYRSCAPDAAVAIGRREHAWAS